MPDTLPIAFFSAVLLLAVKYHDRPVFQEHPIGTPISRGHPLVGKLYSLLSNINKYHDYMNKEFQDHNTLTMGFAFLGAPSTIITIDPKNIEYFMKMHEAELSDLFGNGIFLANGENWKYQRKTASHIFNVSNFRDIFTEVFVKEMKVLNDHVLTKSGKYHTPIDFQEMIYKFTVDSFVHIGFGVHIDAILNDTPVPFAESLDYLQALMFDRLMNPFTCLVELSRTIHPWKKSTSAHLNTVNAFAASVIQQRRKEIENNVTGHKDLLSHFMNTTNHHGNKLSDEELRDAVINFIIAGRDTTAQALSWLFYNIMLHPRLEKKMMEEINTHITDEIEDDAPSFYEAVRKMTYMHAALYESLRLYPPVPANEKYAIHEDVWPDGTRIQAGQYVDWFPYAQGRCTQLWGPHASDYSPERWIDQNGTLKQESDSKWTAFNVGPRTCLGQRLAILESIVAAVMLLRRYSFQMLPDQTITYQTSITCPMKYGMKVFVCARNKST
ncbi:cytochrome P450 [Pilobolus umbonatus]|nr:cytochrome P450 [Pilobolus umbonatus]